MPGILKGSEVISAIYLGDAAVAKVYKGTVQVFPAGGGGEADPLEPKKYWRLAYMHADAGNYIVFGELYLREEVGGDNLIPIHSKMLNHNEGDSDGPQNAYDGDNSNYCHSDVDGNFQQWIAFEYSDPFVPHEVSLSMSSSNLSSRCPTKAVLQWSDTGITASDTWTTYQVIGFGGGWGNSEERHREIIQSPAVVGGHRFWKIGEGVGASGGGDYVVSGNVYFNNEIGGDHSIPQEHFPAGYGQDQYWALYDGLDNTYGHSAPGASGTWEVAFAYNNPQLPAEIWIQAATNNLPERTLHAGNVYWSDDSIEGPWTLYGDFDVGGSWSGGQVKTAAL